MAMKNMPQDLYDIEDTVDGTYQIFVAEDIFCIVYSCAAVYRVHQEEKGQHTSHHDPVFVLEKVP